MSTKIKSSDDDVISITKTTDYDHNGDPYLEYFIGPGAGLRDLEIQVQRIQNTLDQAYGNAEERKLLHEKNPALDDF